MQDNYPSFLVRKVISKPDTLFYQFSSISSTTIQPLYRIGVHKKILGLDEKTEARSSHDCRRTYASLEYLNGTDIRTIQKQMGHTSTGQTWDYIKDIVDVDRATQIKGCGLLENAVF